MAVLEKDIERKLRKMIERHGGRCLKWVCPGWAGVPDRLCLLPGGYIVFIETKRPTGSRTAALQKKWNKWLTELGFRVGYVFDDADLRNLELLIQATAPSRVTDAAKAALARMGAAVHGGAEDAK